MKRLICEDCNRKVYIKDEDYENYNGKNLTCKECQGNLILEGLEKSNEDEEETYSCQECEEKFSEKDLIYFENCAEYFCKSCIDEVYPRDKPEVIIKEVPKFIENDSVLKENFNPEEKSKFD